MERGLAPEDSAVTVVAVRGIYPVCEGTQSEGYDVLGHSRGVDADPRLAHLPSDQRRDPPDGLLCPEHAGEIARAGFSRQDVRQYIFDHARLPVRELDGRGYCAPGCWPGVDRRQNPDAQVRLRDRSGAPRDVYTVGKRPAAVPAAHIAV